MDIQRINTYKRSFDAIAKEILDDDNKPIEVWYARDLQELLGYARWENFAVAINRAIDSCKTQNVTIDDHFRDVRKMIEAGKGAKRKIKDMMLTRYACYLIAQNGDPRKEEIAFAMDYFANNESFTKQFKKDLPTLSVKDELTNFLLYTSPNGKISVEAILHNETVWLSQSQIAQVFEVQVPNISKHIRNIFESKELEENSVVSILETTAQDGKVYQVSYYNLDMIIAVGYRVNSMRATQFRMWATQLLKEFIIKGFILDDYRLKNGQYFGRDYFEDLLEQVRSIRASERRIYQKITDIFAVCSSDYDKRSSEALNFYAEVQNKFHYAISGQTAAEIIYATADADKEFMGLQTFKNAPYGRVVKTDVVVAKNYLTHEKIAKLDRLIGSYFDYIERILENRTILTMKEFAASVIRFLEFNEYRILEGKGAISAQQAKDKAEQEYEVFNRRQHIESDFDRIVKKLEQANMQLGKKEE